MHFITNDTILHGREYASELYKKETLSLRRQETVAFCAET